MRKSYQFFGWIVLMVLGLMAVLVITQINGSRSVDRLLVGNKQAAATFLVNNRLEETVNLSFELESKILTENEPYLFKNRAEITDSISKLLLKADRLEKIMSEAGFTSSLQKIVRLVEGQASLSSAILASGNNVPLLDSLRKKHFGDSIYLNSLEFQIQMESTLGATLHENTQVAKEVSWLNKLLAITALIAILLLGTIIIRRQVKQFVLISDLEEAQKVALQSVKIKDQFLANMSHEIRTPLNALKGFGHLLSKTKLDQEQEQFTGIINNSTESLLHIVNDILDLSKIEAGLWANKNRRFSLHSLLKELGMTYATVASEKKLDFRVSLSDGVEDSLTGDSQRLKQVLTNLISNAIKFTNEGSVSLQVSLPGKTEDIASVHFVVLDTGIGIPHDKQELIFERFEQLDNSFIRQQGGTGLGLAITKMIVESMGGLISVKSEPGIGSAFSFTLSFIITKPQELSQDSHRIPQVRINVDPECKEVLLAEDNKVNQLLIQKYLAPFNVQPVIVENGREVLVLLEKQHFDLVLMDVQMPLMDGITATRLIRKSQGNLIPVVGMTAYVQPKEMEKCYDAGMNDCIPKPIEEQQFLDVVRKYICLDEPALEIVSPARSPAVIDLGFLKQISNGNEASMQVILDTMKAELPGEENQFRSALDRKDVESLRKIAHHMKSTISPLGPQAEIATSLDSFSKNLYPGNDWPAVEESALRLLADLKNCIVSIKNYRDSLIKT